MWLLFDRSARELVVAKSPFGKAITHAVIYVSRLANPSRLRIIAA
jgi:hypothetical protein